MLGFWRIPSKGFHVLGEGVDRGVEVVEVANKVGVLLEGHGAHAKEGLSYLVSFDLQCGLDCDEPWVGGWEKTLDSVLDEVWIGEFSEVAVDWDLCRVGGGEGVGS